MIDIHNTTFTLPGLNKNLTLRADFIVLGKQNLPTFATTGNIVCSGDILLEANGDSTGPVQPWNNATAVPSATTGTWGTLPGYVIQGSVAPLCTLGSIQISGTITKNAGNNATLTLKGKHSIGLMNNGTGISGTILTTNNKLNVVMNSDSDGVNGGAVVFQSNSSITTLGGDVTIGGGSDPTTMPSVGTIGGGNTAGVLVNNMGITTTTAGPASTGGNVSIIGSGFPSGTTNCFGVFFTVSNGATPDATISTGTGSISITGTGGGSTTSCPGVQISGAASATPAAVRYVRLNTSTGPISITGTATVGTNNGVMLASNVDISSTGAAPISITGTGTGTPSGVVGYGILSFPSSTGSATSVVSSTGGTITLKADTMNLVGNLGGTTTISSNAVGGSIAVKQNTATRPIELGLAVDTVTTLGISTPEFARLNAPTITMGDSNSGTINVSAVIAPATSVATLALANNTTFAATGGFTSTISSASNFTKMTVVGAVDINTNATLAMNASGYIWNGTDVFTILDNDAADAITGTFTGPTLSNFLGSALTAQQSYSGGTGNDLVFSAPPSANADLAALTTTAGALSPVFGAGTITYSTPSVPNATATVTVTATRAQANATLEARVNSGAFTSITSATPSGALALNVGANTLQVRVTAQDGTTQKTYTINVTRSAPPGAPTITSAAPARGLIGGGSSIVITGTDFTGATGVNFGSTAATTFTVDSPTQITATLPVGTAGIFDVSVVTGLGTGTGSGLFYYFTTSGSTPAMAASKVDIFTPNGAGKVLPGAPIQYRTLIANTGGGNANSVDFADAIPANTTLVPGSVNVSPLAEDDVYTTIVNTQLAAGTPTVLSGPLVTSAVKVTANDREFLTDTFTLSASDSTSAAGGSVVMSSDGSFTYVPPAGFVGADSFTYTIRDDGADSTAGNADDLAGIGTVVINVTEADTVASGTQKVWYIDNSYAGANGAENGTSARPFNALSDVTAASGTDVAGDTLALRTGSGDYTGGITLLADQTLVGANEALVLNSITLATAGTDPVIANSGGAGITLATGNTLRGFTVGNTSGGDIAGTAVGTLTVSNVVCNGTGPIFTVSNSGALAVTLETATTTNSGTTGISLTGCTGSFTTTAGAISGVTGDDVLISGGTANISIGSSITNTAARPVNVANKTAGTVTFSGAISDTGTGISLSTNTGSTISFTGGINSSTGTIAAFAATGGGTVNVTGANNTLTTTTAAALNVTNTTIGASGLTFRSISSNGGTSNGIILDTTGTSGGLTVTGDGSNTSPGGNSSGGTIANKSGTDGSTTQGIGIYLNNTRDVVLRRMSITGVNQNFGIRGFGVTNFTLQYCTVGSPTPTNSGSIAANLQGTNNSSIGEGAIYFGNQTDGILGLTGTASIDNCFISAGRTDNMQLSNGGGTLNRLAITNSTFGYNFTGTPSVANAALTVVARRASSGNTLLNSTVTGCTFVGTPGNAANFTGQEPTTTLGIAMDTIFQNNTITNDHLQNLLGGSNITIAGFSSTTFNISNNSLRDANGSAITLQMGAPGAGSTVATALSGTINNNTIGVIGVAGSGSASGNGIFFSFADNTTAPKGQVNVAVTNNIIRNYSGNAGIYADNTGGDYDLNFTCTGNTAAEPGPGAFAGLALAAGGPTTNDDIDIFARITGNNFSTGDPNNANDIIVGGGANGASTIKLAGAGGPADGVAFASLAAVQTFLFNNNNTVGTVASAYTDAPATVAMFRGAGATNPPLPSTLLFAQNEAQVPVKSRSDLVDLTDGIEVSAVNPVKKAPKAPQGRFAPQAALTQATLEKLAAQAISRWEASGLTPAQKQRLQALRFELSDLNTLHLGQASGDLIQISRTAAGNAWFIDETPSDDAEFERRTGFQPVSADNGLKVRSTIQGVDLLTTIMHEMGHTLGLPDRYDLRSRRSIMYGHLSTGERRLPAPGEAAGATPFTDDTTRLLGATINIGTLPAGKSVTIVGTVLVNDPANTQLISSQGTVSGSNFSNILTDDPAFAGAANPTTTPVERPDAAVVSLNRASGSPRSAATATWQIVFDQPVSGLTSANFAAVNGGLGGVITVSEPTELSGPPSTTWNITVTTGTGSGTLGLNMVNDSGSLSHDITNQPFTGQVYTIDKIAPVFSSITRQTPSAQNTNADTLVFRATFSEAVLGVDAADFTVSGTTATITSVSGTGPYDITFSGGDLANLNGTVGLALAGGQNIADAAGNALPGTAPATNETYTVDNTAPTVAISSTTGNPAPNAVIPVTVTFNESVTGFDLTDITVAGGTKTNFAGTGAIYTFDLTPSGPGVTVTADVAGSAAQDAAGNNNSAATQFTRSIVDAVSIAATTATAVEGGATGLYTFTRGASSGDLTVSFQLDAGSTATAATDFNLTSGGTLAFNTGTGAGTIVIPNGQLTATVTLTALAETPNPAEAAETARLNVVAGSGYVAGGSPNATVTITENSFLVTTTADSGTGSLRQAVDNANSIAGTDTITFSDGTGGTVNFTDASADTITLSSGQISLESSLTIAGAGANLLILQNTAAASGTSRVLSLPNIVGSKTIQLRGLTLTGGNVTGPGGGLHVDGGASANLSIIGCTIRDNQSSGIGAGIYSMFGGANLTVINSTISGNTSAGSGGGGGIHYEGFGVTLINTTVSGNSITTSHFDNAGGFWSSSTSSTLRNSTITDNSSVGGASGMRAYVSVNVANSIIASNVNNTTLPDVVGTAFTSGGGNLIGNSGTATGFINGTNSDQVGTGASPINPQLAALANNGGRTQTHALLAASPALNAGLIAQIPADTFDVDGDLNTTEVIDVDQRGPGFIRAIGTVDIGAFELQKSVSIGNLAAISEGNSGTTNFVFTITRTGDTSGSVAMTYTVSGAAVNGTDFIGGTLPTGTATITNGNAITTVTIPVSGDTSAELNEAFIVTLTAPDNGYVVAGAPATSTINNDDTLTVTINQAAAQADPTNAISINYTVVFSEAVTDFDDAADVTLTGTAGATTSIITGGPTTYNVAVSGMTGSGTVIAAVPATVALSAGGAANAASTSTDATVTRDVTAPALASAITISDTALKIGDTATVTFTFTEAVTGFTAADVTVPNGTLSTPSSSNGGITWTAILTPNASVTATTNQLALDNTGFTDAVGNAGVGTSNSGFYAIDTARPTVGIVVADTALRIGETSLVTLTFSEAVTGFTNADLSIANGTLTSVSTADSGVTWTATLTPTASITDTTHVITLDNSGIADLAGNAGTGTTDSNNYAIDTVRPTVGIVVADTALRIGETSLVTLTFSEAVTGFTNADLSIANGTLTSVSTADSGVTWTATLTPTASVTDTTNVITLDNSGLTDLAGNAGTGTTDSNNYAIDTIFPTVALSSTAPDPTPLVVISVTAQFSESVVNFTAGDITPANATVSNFVAVDGDTYTFDLTPSGSNLVVTADVAASAAQDAAGNNSSAATQFARTINAAPEITVPLGAGGSGPPVLYGISNGYGTAANNQIYEINPATGSISNARQVTLAGFTVTNSQSLAAHPTTGVLYGVIQTTGGASARRLVTIDPATGVATQIVPFTGGLQFATLAFKPDGTLIGGTGQGGTTPETLYTLSTVDASATLLLALGNGADGETIAFHPNGLLYHSSGNSNALFESVNLTTNVVTPIGSASGEMFAMGFHTPTATMLGSDISGNMFSIDIATGARTPIGPINGPDDNRGLALAAAPGVPLLRLTGVTTGINSPIATVSDAETTAGSLVVTATTVPPGINITNIVNNAGAVTADVSADAGMTAGIYTLVLNVFDGAINTSATLTIEVNNAPTVVAPGIPDQTAVVGLPAVVVPLGAHFADVDLDTLTFSVTGNTDPTKATSVLTGGTSVTLTALAFGQTDVTIHANDNNGGTVTDTFRVFARTIDPTATMPATPVGGWPYSQVNGFFNIQVPVQNTTANAINGLRLRVNVSAFLGAHPSLRLWNATRTIAPGIFEIDYPYPVASLATVQFSLSFYTSTRLMPNPFAPVLTVIAVNPSIVPGPLPAGLVVLPSVIRFTAAGLRVLEWDSSYGKWYRIYYNNGLDPNQWLECTTPIQAGSNRQQWQDNGAPFTRDPPVGARFYIITEIPSP